VLRRVDALAAKASASDDPSRALIAEVRTAAEHPGVAVGPSPANRTALRQAGRAPPPLTGPEWTRLVTHVCLLCGIPHKRHYADGGVMRPVELFGLVRALPAVILSA
jgi:hypothetical protein